MGTSEEDKEHLLTITTKDGKTFDIYRQGGNVSACSQDHCLILPKSPGHQTLELIALLDEIGEIQPEDDNGTS